MLSLSCNKKEERFTICGTMRCPADRNVIYLSIVNGNGIPTKASYIETYNTRTGRKEINLQDSPNYPGGESYKYRLFFNPRAFSTEGDYVVVLVKSETGKEFKVNYLMQGGDCACDVKKVDGPDVLKIE